MAHKIGVGINENVYLKAVSQDPQNNSLDFTFDLVQDKRFNAFEALQQENVTIVDMTANIKLFSPNVPNHPNINTEEKMLKAIEGDINRAKGILIHILKGYTTDDRWGRIGKELFNGIEIDANNYSEKIRQQPVLTAVFNNMARIFMEEIKEFLGNESLKFRLLLIRQSKDKHYASFRGGNYIEDSPFWESMEIPKEASKVAFSPYEIKEGLNDGTATSRSQGADNKTDKGSAPQSAANIFGQQ